VYTIGGMPTETLDTIARTSPETSPECPQHCLKHRLSAPDITRNIA